MKPVNLSLAGLQSYREKQEVDFTVLSDAGVFGIFGPTGSGKSSILDAVTLALYGKVERAPGGTQGIINQLENECAVSFEFELTGAEGAERYRVERRYKRTGDVSVNQSVARLMRLENGGAAVLADKAKDVDSRIQHILGLSMADFTRAVVLPQGKFAEFLSLKGVERRHMLERLFHLEPYGDGLSAKVGAAAREAAARVKHAEAEELGLGDASIEALKEAEERLRAAEARAVEERRLLQAAEREAEAARELWRLCREQSSLMAEEGNLAAQQPEMEALSGKLRASGLAVRVEHFLREWEEAETLVRDAEKSLGEAESGYARATEWFEQTRSAWEEARACLSRKEEPLQEQLVRLARALELHGELREEAGRKAACREREQAAAAALEGLQAQIAAEEKQYDKAVQLQAQLKQDLAAVQLEPGQRETLQGAMLERQRWEAAALQLEQTENELRGGLTALDQWRQAREACGKELNESLSLHSRCLEEAALMLGSLQEAEAAAEALQSAVRLGEAEERRRGEERLRAALAAGLSEALVQGEPCPVCGSLHHPAPASGAGDREQAEQSAAELWPGLGNRVTELRFMVKRLQSALEGELSRSEPLLPEREAAAGAAMSAREAAAAASWAGASGGPAHILAFPEAEARLQQAEARLRQQEEDIRRLAAALRRNREQCGADRTRLAETDAKLSAMESAVQAAEVKAAEVRQAERQLREDWTLRYPQLRPEHMQEEWDKLQDKLRAQEELSARLERAEPYLESSRQKQRQFREEAFRLEREAVQAATERKGRESVESEKRQRLGELLLGESGGESEAATEELHRRAAMELHSLKNAEAEKRQALERLQTAQSEGASRLAACRQAAESAKSALDRARSNGERELLAAGFATGKEAREALLAPAEAALMEERTTRHREQWGKVKAQLEQVAAALGGRSIREEEWTARENQLALQRAKDEECLLLKAKAERDLEELSMKHERWNILERERLAAGTLLDRLQRLQSVLRGNAFVEFMAMEQLLQVSKAASDRLGQLTRRRYALETDSTGGFIIRDDANGGLRRPVSTLSGGETFLTSLSLALALSAQIQLNGKHPLEFFFLDEGFGTLDPDLLETVVYALEKLHMERLTVGVISHVPELKSRLPRRLVVIPAEAAGAGSRIAFESL